MWTYRTSRPVTMRIRHSGVGSAGLNQKRSQAAQARPNTPRSASAADIANSLRAACGGEGDGLTPPFALLLERVAAGVGLAGVVGAGVVRDVILHPAVRLPDDRHDPVE